jgi:hypothetical protein
VKIQNPGRRLSNEEVQLFERRLGLGLPGSYRTFLLEYNGGQPCPDCVDIPGLEGSPTDIQLFFGIDREVVSSNLDWNLETYPELPLRGLLPIACDSGGGLFCVRFAGSETGQIEFVNAPSECNASYLVSPDLGQFLSAIRDF